MHRPHSQNSLDQLASPPGRVGYFGRSTTIQTERPVNQREKWGKNDKETEGFDLVAMISMGPSHFNVTADVNNKPIFARSSSSTC